MEPMPNVNHRIFLRLTILAATLVVAQAAFGQNSIRDLGTLGGRFASATHINDRGLVAGVSETESGEIHPFVWARGVMLDLGTLGDDFATVFIRGINKHGQVVGTFEDVSGAVRASFFWDAGELIDLGSFGGTRTVVTDINDKGQVVGSSTTASGEFRAFRWYRGTMTDLGTLGGDYAAAHAINNKGQIVGVSETASGDFHAFHWEGGQIEDIQPDFNPIAISENGLVAGQLFTATETHAALWRHGHASRGDRLTKPHGRVTDLGTLGGGWAVASLINSNGQVAGESETDSGAIHAFFWQQGRMIDLGTLGGFESTPNGMNASGKVVGASETESGDYHAFYWRKGIMTDLGTVGGISSTAFAINESGQIVGSSTDESGETRAVLWKK